MANMSPRAPQQQENGTGQAQQERTRGFRLLMSWEDWVTLFAAAIVFISLAASVQAAELVRNMPPLIPTMVAGLVLGLFAARIRGSQLAVHLGGLLLGAGVVVLAVQSYAEGASLPERISNAWVRMEEWFHIVRVGDISNDNLPFVALVHAIAFAVAYVGTWAIYRWHNAWIGVLPVGALLLVNISVMEGQPSTWFVFFLFGALVLVARMNLQKLQTRWRREGVEYPEFMSLSVAQLTVVLAAGLMIVAWMVPLGTQARAVEQTVNFATQPFGNYTDHFVRIFHNLNIRGGGEFYTYGDTLPVSGNINLGSKDLYEVDGGMIDDLERMELLRAASYDEYTGVGWRATDREEVRSDGGQVHGSDPEDYHARDVSTLHVTVLDSDSVVLFHGTPVGTNLETIVETAAHSPGDVEMVRPRRGLGSGDGYNAVGAVSRASSDQLREAESDYPDWIAERYLQLPNELPESVISTAVNARGNADNPYDIAVAIEEYFRAMPFDLEAPAAPPGEDTVEYLITELGGGHFLYHATGMAVMLRTQGVPARLTIGYALDPELVEGEAPHTVSREDSYAWVEVYFPQYGWVNFNPTGDRPGIGETDLSGLEDDSFPVGDIDPAALEGLFGPEGPVENLPPELEEPLQEDPVKGPSGFPWWIAWTFGGVVFALGAVASAGYISWNWSVRGLPPRVQAWAKTQRLSKWAGLAWHDDETPTEWSRRMGRSLEHEDAARVLARAYEEARYGRPEQQRVDDSEALGAYRELRGALVRTIFARRQRKRRGE